MRVAVISERAARHRCGRTGLIDFQRAVDRLARGEGVVGRIIQLGAGHVGRLRIRWSRCGSVILESGVKTGVFIARWV